MPYHLDLSANLSKCNSLMYELLLRPRAMFSFRRGARRPHAGQKESCAERPGHRQAQVRVSACWTSTHFCLEGALGLWHHFRRVSFVLFSTYYCPVIAPRPSTMSLYNGTPFQVHQWEYSCVCSWIHLDFPWTEHLFSALPPLVHDFGPEISMKFVRLLR